MIPLRVLMPESPRWLASKGRIDKADKVVSMLESEAVKEGKPLPEPVVRPVDPKATAKSDWRELFKGIYLKRTLMIWVLWIAVYIINNGMVTWLPTLYTPGVQAAPADQPALRLDHLRRRRASPPSLCALYIDKVGRKRWYTVAFLLATVPLVILTALGATTATQVVILAPSPTRSCRPSRSRSTCTPPSSTPPACAPSAPASAAPGCAPDPPSAPSWSGSSSPASASATCSSPSPSSPSSAASITARFGIETKGKVLEELSP